MTFLLVTFSWLFRWTQHTPLYSNRPKARLHPGTRLGPPRLPALGWTVQKKGYPHQAWPARRRFEVQPGWVRVRPSRVGLRRPGHDLWGQTFADGLPRCSEQKAGKSCPHFSAGLSLSMRVAGNSLSDKELDPVWWMSLWKMARAPGAVRPCCSSTTGIMPRSS